MGGHRNASGAGSKRRRSYDESTVQVDPPRTYDDPLLEAVLDDAVTVCSDWWSRGFAAAEASSTPLRPPRSMRRINGNRLLLLATWSWESGVHAAGGQVDRTEPGQSVRIPDEQR